MHTITLPAVVANLSQAQQFIEAMLDAYGAPMSVILQVSLVVEEVFVNIAQYAYAPAQGMVTLSADITNTSHLTLQFEDSGMPFNPLVRTPPDVTQSAEEREIGGLGIFLAQQFMDTLTYAYVHNTNILTLQKQLPTL